MRAQRKDRSIRAGLDTQVDRLCDEFESTWAAGTRPDFDDYLVRAPEANRPALFRELLGLELDYLADSGEAISPDGYLDRYGQWSQIIHELFDQLTPSPSEAKTVHVAPDARRCENPVAAIPDGTPRARRRENASAGFAAGQRVDHYQLDDEHARGGFGLVWRANDRKLGRLVALKQISAQMASHAECRRRFIAEARIAARLEHPGVVPVYDMGNPDDRLPYYTMKFVRGDTLAEAIRRFHEGSKPPGERAIEQLRLLNVFLAVTRTMEYTHAQGIVHRDLKPQNIILGDYGETVILDWGLAKEFEEDLASVDSVVMEALGDEDSRKTRAGTVQGTPAYMSPEQASGSPGDVDQRSDVYSLGAILYQILTGRVPFGGNSTDEILKKVRHDELRRPRLVDSGVPKALEAICMKAMAKEPCDRYAEVSQMSADLERYLADEPVSVYRQPFTVRLGRWARRHRTLVASTAVAVLLIVIGTVVALVARQRARQQLYASVGADHALVIAELHEGRFDSAEKIMAKTLERLRSEGRLDELRAKLEKEQDEIRNLGKFYRLSDRAWMLAGEEREVQALDYARGALERLGTAGGEQWWQHLPGRNLTEQQRDELAHDAHSLLLLQAALLAKGAVLDFTNPRTKDDCLRALDILKRAQAFKPSHFSRLVENFCYFRLGQNDKLRPLEGIEPDQPADYFFFGFIYLWMGQFPDGAATQLVRGMVRQISGLEFSEPLVKAQRYPEKAAELEPREYWHHFMVGWALAAGRDYRGAELAFGTCIALRPEHPAGYVGRGTMMLREGQSTGKEELVREGLEKFQRALKLAPHEPWVYWTRGDVFAVLGRTSEALNDARRAMELAWPAPKPMPRVPDVRDYCRRLLKNDPDNANLHGMLAMALVRLGSDKEALKAAERALKLDSNNAPALIARGTVHLNRKHFKPAIKDFNKVLAKQPDTYPAAAGRARALELQARHPEALAAFDRLLKIAGSDWQIQEAQRGRTRALKQLGRDEEA